MMVGPPEPRPPDHLPYLRPPTPQTTNCHFSAFFLPAGHTFSCQMSPNPFQSNWVSSCQCSPCYKTFSLKLVSKRPNVKFGSVCSFIYPSLSLSDLFWGENCPASLHLSIIKQKFCHFRDSGSFLVVIYGYGSL